MSCGSQLYIVFVRRICLQMNANQAILDQIHFVPPFPYQKTFIAFCSGHKRFSFYIITSLKPTNLSKGVAFEKLNYLLISKSHALENYNYE